MSPFYPEGNRQLGIENGFLHIPLSHLPIEIYTFRGIMSTDDYKEEVVTIKNPIPLSPRNGVFKISMLYLPSRQGDWRIKF